MHLYIYTYIHTYIHAYIYLCVCFMVMVISDLHNTELKGKKWRWIHLNVFFIRHRATFLVPLWTRSMHQPGLCLHLRPYEGLHVKWTLWSSGVVWFHSAMDSDGGLIGPDPSQQRELNAKNELACIQYLILGFHKRDSLNQN